MPTSPYSTKFASGEIDHELNPAGQMKRFKKEENQTHNAPNILPYELGNLPDIYSRILENAIQASKTIDAALKSKEVRRKKELLRLKNDTDKMARYILMNVDAVLEKQTIGARHLGDPDEEFDEYA